MINRVINERLRGEFSRLLVGYPENEKVALGLRFSTLISILSPNGVRIWEISIESSPFMLAPVRLAIIPVSIVILMSMLDQIGVG